MIRVLSLLVIASLSYFGLTFLVEHLQPEVKNMTSEPPSGGTKLNINGLPDEVLGTFSIDLTTSGKWLKTQTALDADSKIYFDRLQNSQKQFTFDGKSIWFSDQLTETQVKFIRSIDKTLEFELVNPGIEHKGSNTFFLQWDDKGGIWYSNYSHLEEGKKMLYRARYKKQAANKK